MRRQGSRTDARAQLRAAGRTTLRQAVTTTVKLTAQKAQIARPATEGLSNPEIATRLSLSPDTVQYYLGMAFTKLDTTSRPAQPRPARMHARQPATRRSGQTGGSKPELA